MADNIWGEFGCSRCGACCYAAEIPELGKPTNMACPNLEIDISPGLASCKIYDDGRPNRCDEWSCAKGNNQGENKPCEAHISYLRHVAEDILRTRPQDHEPGREILIEIYD